MDDVYKKANLIRCGSVQKPVRLGPDPGIVNWRRRKNPDSVKVGNKLLYHMTPNGVAHTENGNFE